METSSSAKRKLVNSPRINRNTFLDSISIDNQTLMSDNVGMTKAHASLRVSGKGQVEGDGFARQLKAIKEYAATHDIKIVKVFREEGVRGTTESADRPAWSELMMALHSNGVRAILIEKLDLTR